MRPDFTGTTRGQPQSGDHPYPTTFSPAHKLCDRPVARPIGLTVEAGSAPLLGHCGDYRSDAAPAQVSAGRPARERLVAGHPPGSQARAPPLTADRAGIEQGGKHRAVVPHGIRQ
jgi:hypothetical protein